MSIRRAVVLLVPVWALAAAAGHKTDIDIVPGPTAISAAEAAIAADPEHGVQHGVILSQETELDETSLTGYTLTYHLRAKILSPEGRSLADVEVQVNDGAESLKTWWGRTVLPTGEVKELKKDALTFQTATKTLGAKSKVLKAALPGVVPGSVIDFGYTIYNEGYYRSKNVPIEQAWPVRSFRYRWVPSSHMPAAYAAAHVEGKPIQIVHDRNSILVTASGLAPVADEPYMPPEGEVRASITLFYSPDSEEASEYWNLAAKRVQSKFKAFGSGGAIKDVINQLQVPPDATLDQKLRAAYDWIATHVQNSYLKTAEQEEATNDDDDAARARDSAKVVLAAREGTSWQIDKLFLTAARALGADAQPLYATDRTERFWQFGFKSLEQFEFGFVAVRPPGAGDGAWTIVDPGSGLPYGELPWRATGVSGFLCLPTGRGVLQIPPSPPTKNRADTHVTVAFSKDNETRTIKWSRTGQGAAGMDWRRWLRGLDPDERKKQLDEACGGIGSGEVVAAELPGLDDPTAPFQIACDVEMETTGLDESIGRYQLDAVGPWWPRTPELTAPTRTQPMIFDYPSLDVVSVDVVAPEGFAAEPPPEPVKLQSPYGRYEFWVRKTDAGFHVDRVFALTPLVVRANDYETLKHFLEQVRTADRMALAFRRSQARP